MYGAADSLDLGSERGGGGTGSLTTPLQTDRPPSVGPEAAGRGSEREEIRVE